MISFMNLIAYQLHVKKCGDHAKTLNEYYMDIDNNRILSWNRWEKLKQPDGKEQRVVVTKRGHKTYLLKGLIDKDIRNPAQGMTFCTHYFNACWQNIQYQQIKKDLPKDTILQVMDFAKNREIKYQDDIKGTFYTAGQITLHPIINYYMTDIGMVRESSVVISEDNRHDFHAVHHFQDLVNNHIFQQVTQKPRRLIVYSHGCSSQYKSKGPFADLAAESIEINRNYFESEHGKNECDGEIGVINRAIDRAIIGNRVIINNAEDLYKYSQEHLEINEPLTKRKFFFVKENKTDRGRPKTEVKTHLPYTRKINQICNIKSQNTCLKSRPLSCFCKVCELGEDMENCLKQEIC